MTTSIRTFHALTFVVFMSVLHFGHSGSSNSKSRRKDEDIAQFYCTNATILTLYTTVSPTECKTDYVNKTGNQSTEFLRRFTSRHERATLNLTGIFTNGRKTLQYETYDAMDVLKETVRRQIKSTTSSKSYYIRTIVEAAVSSL
uniref:Putative lipocalin n=1 Tax=Rhipicephalus microplus TaxID=6941 RepID=A0A6G5A2Q3_RHIMP